MTDRSNAAGLPRTQFETRTSAGRGCSLDHPPVSVAYPGFQREGCLRSGPIQKVWGGGGGGGASGPIYEKWGGPKVGTCRYFLVETTYVTQAENFTYIGCIA